MYITSNEFAKKIWGDTYSYIVMTNRLVEMGEESPVFMEAKPYATGSVFTAILYLMDLVGFSESLGALSYILAFTSTIISLHILYKIGMGVIEIDNT